MLDLARPPGWGDLPFFDTDWPDIAATLDADPRDILPGRLAAQADREGGAGVAGDRDPAFGEVGEHAVHAIERGARHQSDVEIAGGHGAGETAGMAPALHLSIWKRGAQSALAWTTENAAASSVRAPTAMRSKAGRIAAVIGAPPSCAIEVGFW